MVSSSWRSSRGVGVSIGRWLVRRHLRGQSPQGSQAMPRAEKESRSCRSFGSTHSQSPSMVTAPVPTRTWTIRWASAAWRCTQWVLGTKTFQKMHADFAASLIGDEVAREGVDDDFAARGFENLGAWILGRNMFGPMRGPWSDDSWKGWWGPNPPYHVPVFVLTHHARAPITMEGGTTFHFVTDGIHAALKRAKEAAQGKDVRLGGGVATIRQYLTAGSDRRDPPRDLPRAARPGRAPPRRHRHGEPRLQVHRARRHEPGHARRPDEVTPHPFRAARPPTGRRRRR